MSLNILKTTINIGIKSPIKILHVTDTHIAKEDPTGWGREKLFDTAYDGSNEDYAAEIKQYVKDNKMLMLHTGDFIDFFSEANFKITDEYFSDIDYVYAAGNHDFCHFLGKAAEDYEYKWAQIGQIAPHIKSNLYFDSKLVGGVNIVTIDNSYYLFTEGQLELLKAEVAKGYPIIIGVHVPIFNDEQANSILETGNNCAYLCGAPTELLATYPEDRRIQQTPDAPTLKMIEYIKSQPLIKAIIAGHTHKNFEEKLTDSLVQYTTDGSFRGYVREITIM